MKNMLLQDTSALQPLKDTVTNTINALQATQGEELSLFELLTKGGWVMIPIGFLLLMGIYIFIERYLTIRKSSKDESNLMFQIKQNIHEGRLESAIALCKNTKSPLARMLEKGLKRIGRPIKDIEGAIENTGKLEVSKLEKNIGILGIIVDAKDKNIALFYERFGFKPLSGTNNRLVLPFSALIEYSPLSFEITPLLVPFTNTFTP